MPVNSRQENRRIVRFASRLNVSTGTTASSKNDARTDVVPPMMYNSVGSRRTSPLSALCAWMGSETSVKGKLALIAFNICKILAFRIQQDMLHMDSRINVSKKFFTGTADSNHYSVLTSSRLNPIRHYFFWPLINFNRMRIDACIMRS